MPAQLAAGNPAAIPDMSLLIGLLGMPTPMLVKIPPLLYADLTEKFIKPPISRPPVPAPNIAPLPCLVNGLLDVKSLVSMLAGMHGHAPPGERCAAGPPPLDVRRRLMRAAAVKRLRKPSPLLVNISPLLYADLTEIEATKPQISCSPGSILAGMHGRAPPEMCAADAPPLNARRREMRAAAGSDSPPLNVRRRLMRTAQNFFITTTTTVSPLIRA